MKHQIVIDCENTSAGYAEVIMNVQSFEQPIHNMSIGVILNKEFITSYGFATLSKNTMEHYEWIVDERAYYDTLAFNFLPVTDIEIEMKVYGQINLVYSVDIEGVG